MAVNDTVECDGAGNTADLTAWLDANGGAEATDACSGPVIWTNNFASLSDLCGETGESDVTFTATDSCGNASTTTARFVIEDTTAPDMPTMVCPADTVIYLDASCSVDTTSATLGLATSSASDVCDANPTLDEYYSDSELLLTCTGDDDDKQGSYSFTRTFYAAATDACGLTGDTADCVQTITVLDTLAPVITADSVYTISCELYDPATLYAVSASDNCDSDAAITIDSNNEQSGACPATYLRVYKAIDDCGNYSTYEQIVKRLKEERIGFENKLEARELTLKAKEADYEELLLMSHDANQSKEMAKQELSKFEALVSEERKLREKDRLERTLALMRRHPRQLVTCVWRRRPRATCVLRRRLLVTYE